MMKKFKDGFDGFLAVDLMVFFILSGIMLTILISPLIHRLDVNHYRLDIYSGLSKEEIARNFSSLANYLWIFNREPLALESFVMSTNGAVHFAEVKNIVDALQILWLITGIGGGTGAYFEIKQQDFTFLKKTAMLMILVPLAIGITASLNFSAAFVTFHRLFFRNDYWIFDVRTDPVISILPEQFFMHGFFAIVLIVVLCALILYGLYRYKTKKLSL